MIGRRWLPAVVVVTAAALVASGCGGGGEASASDIVKKAFEATQQSGSVLHIKGDDSSELWADVAKQEFRRLESLQAGHGTSVGSGWSKTSYDPSQNKVLSEDLTPASATGPQPRIGNPVARWLEAYTALSYAPELKLLGNAQADGIDVIVLEGRSPVLEQGQFAGKYLVGRVELDAKTYLPHAFERRLELPAGQTAPPTGPGIPGGNTNSAGTTRIVYTTVEWLPRDKLAADFFSTKAVEKLVVTLAQNLQTIRDLGLEPYWLGEHYAGAVTLSLPTEAEGVTVEPDTGRAAFHYQLELPDALPSADAVIVQLAAADKAADLGQPSIPEFGGTLPEQKEEADVRGGAGTMYISLLSPSDLPCGAGTDCPKSSAPLYYRLVFSAGKTALQVITFARVDTDGSDANKSNTRDGIIALAEALTVAQ